MRRGDWIQTFTGVQFWPLDPRAEEIRIEDIAHALSMQCRFAGHTKAFYSVAQHCVLVADLVHLWTLGDPELAMCGLLHDAAEAYLTDVCRPVKRLHTMAPYREAEYRLEALIARTFSLPEPWPEPIKRADSWLLATEARDLMAPLHPDWQHTPERIGALEKRIVPLGPAEAEALFLRLFRTLTDQRAGAR